MTDRQYVIPTQPGMGRGLVNHDDASKAYRAVSLTDQTKPRTHRWRRASRAYDQGETTECVPNAGKGVLNTYPRTTGVPYSIRGKYDRHEWYHGSQLNDQWVGEDYDGTSALGLCRYLKSLGIISGYHWTFGLDEFLLALSWVGPLATGLMWKGGMMRTDSAGMIHDTGSDVGGHETEWLALDMNAGWAEGINSWGPDWGVRGRFRMPFDEIGARLEDAGDSVSVTV